MVHRLIALGASETTECDFTRKNTKAYCGTVCLLEQYPAGVTAEYLIQISFSWQTVITQRV
jgi:hypothetical protein